VRVLTLILLTALSCPALPQSFPPLPSDLPLNADGVPSRPLTDDELHRLLLSLSARNDAAAVLLARCHAAGQGYGAPGWRACIDGGT
jgi:hypothetical protein